MSVFLFAVLVLIAVAGVTVVSGKRYAHVEKHIFPECDSLMAFATIYLLDTCVPYENFFAVFGIDGDNNITFTLFFDGSCTFELASNALEKFDCGHIANEPNINLLEGQAKMVYADSSDCFQDNGEFFYAFITANCSPFFERSVLTCDGDMLTESFFESSKCEGEPVSRRMFEAYDSCGAPSSTVTGIQGNIRIECTTAPPAKPTSNPLRIITAFEAEVETIVSDIKFDKNSNLYMLDLLNDMIWVFNVSSGDTTPFFFNNASSLNSFAPTNNARLSAFTITENGVVLVADLDAKIRKIEFQDRSSVLFADVSGAVSITQDEDNIFGLISAFASDRSGNLYIATANDREGRTHPLIKVDGTKAKTLSRFTTYEFIDVLGMTIDPVQNVLYVSECGVKSQVSRVDLGTGVVSRFAGAQANFQGAFTCQEKDAHSLNTCLGCPGPLAVDRNHNVYILDILHNVIFRVNHATRETNVFLGKLDHSGNSEDFVVSSNVVLGNPTAVTVNIDVNFNIFGSSFLGYVFYYDNNRLRAVLPTSLINNIIESSDDDDDQNDNSGGSM